LTYGRLGNHNAQGGEGNHTDIKQYDGRPYLSGQTIRQAFREALHEGERGDEMRCTPSQPCGQVDECMLCDVFGYFAEGTSGFPKETPAARRGPLSVPFALAEHEVEITPDQLAQYDDVSGDKDHNLATRDVAAAVYRGGWTLNADRVGHRRIEDIDEDADYTESYRRTDNRVVSADVQAERVAAVVRAAMNLRSFAGQARHAADWTPDLVVIGVQSSARNRLLSALKTTDGDSGTPTLATQHLESILSDVDGQLYAAGNYDPDLISNWDETMDVLEGHDTVAVVDSVTAAYEKAAELATEERAE
jgi:CRISPR-associated protein Cas7/Cst2/DevR subtype I-B